MTQQAKARIQKSMQQSENAALIRLETALAEIDAETPVTITANGKTVEIPWCVAQFVGQYASLLRRGHGASLVPLSRNLSTQEAAGLLGVSRPYLVRLVDSGEIPHVKVGNRRRLVLDDVLEYKQVRDSVRRESLRELVRLDDEQGLFALEMECD